jgi:type VI secretion system protein VasD
MAIRPSSKASSRAKLLADLVDRLIGGLRTRTETRHWTCRVGLIVAACAACLVTGCGVAQALKSAALHVSQSPGAPLAKTITFDLAAQPLINPDPDGQPLSVALRFYQLTDVTTFAELTYVQFQRSDQKLLKDDLLATKDVILRPGASTRITEPMNEATQFVGVIAFFREPSQDKTWKLAIARERGDEAAVVRIEADGDELRLVRADSHVK